ncbi:TetR/AcrR family transcriptional regulator [Paraburkholderia sp.]|uniref:TetR/AcrR family transcriptional regulator n=1 Tax=Paraburkholderia sp. TaxID=1926495 RepID=UPI0023A6C510|nr:TetR/AcrR family transcriptional regulator [Paraburkholderia sp.]MDE1180141.1 TetR/AcrR family transcriptional regulator [Paraburkholderia sp.]
MARPRAFDEQDVLEAAGQAFWSRGYEGTSTRDLVKATGLSQPSLYNAFGDKRGLFHAALERYLDQTARERITRIETALPPAQALSSYLGEIVELSLADPQKRGCLLVNATLEITPDHAEFRETVAGSFTMIRDFFVRCLSAAQQAGDIAPTIPVEDAATHLLATMLGTRVLARLDPGRAVLTAALGSALALLGLPPLSAQSTLSAPPDTAAPAVADSG